MVGKLIVDGGLGCGLAACVDQVRLLDSEPMLVLDQDRLLEGWAGGSACCRIHSGAASGPGACC